MVKNHLSNAGDAGDTGSNPGWGRSPGGGYGNLLPAPVFLPKNPMYRGAWWNTVHNVTKSRTQLSD